MQSELLFESGLEAGKRGDLVLVENRGGCLRIFHPESAPVQLRPWTAEVPHATISSLYLVTSGGKPATPHLKTTTAAERPAQLILALADVGSNGTLHHRGSVRLLGKVDQVQPLAQELAAHLGYRLVESIWKGVWSAEATTLPLPQQTPSPEALRALGRLVFTMPRSDAV